MKVTKFGHSCLLIQEGEARVLIDPGVWSRGFQELQNLNAILITHEHPDHLDSEALKIVLKNNPSVKIYTNKGAGKILSENGIAFELLENGQSTKLNGVLIEGFGEKHAAIYKDIPEVDDTGYMIAEKFFYSGDALHMPPKPVEVLAMTAYAPWGTIQDIVDQVKKINPKICFPVHDGILKNSEGFWNPVVLMAEKLLQPGGVEIKILEEGKEYEF